MSAAEWQGWIARGSEEGVGEVSLHGAGRQAGDEAVWMDAQELAGWE